MIFRTITFRIALLSLLLVAVPFAAFADTIRLKNGGIIKGRIVRFSAGRFVVSIGDGARLKEMTFASEEVESITFDAPAERPQVTQAVSPNKKEVRVFDPVSQPPQVIVTNDTSRPDVTPVSSSDRTIIRKPSGNAPPISWNIKVLADNTSNGWTNSGWVLKKGQRIRITGEGNISLGKGNSSGAAGLGDLQDDLKLLKNVPTGALLAVIGDDNNDFIYIGIEREFTATRDGALYLGINEGFLDDNSGAFNVKVEILPDQK